MENEKDDILWKKAEARVGFKKHLTTYVLVNIFIWIIWYFTTAPYYDGFPWAAYVTLGWGIGIVANYIQVYVNDGVDAVEKEYEKLKNRDRH